MFAVCGWGHLLRYTRRLQSPLRRLPHRVRRPSACPINSSRLFLSSFPTAYIPLAKEEWARRAMKKPIPVPDKTLQLTSWIQKTGGTSSPAAVHCEDEEVPPVFLVYPSGNPRIVTLQGLREGSLVVVRSFWRGTRQSCRALVRAHILDLLRILDLYPR